LRDERTPATEVEIAQPAWFNEDTQRRRIGVAASRAQCRMGRLSTASGDSQHATEEQIEQLARDFLMKHHNE
jgi:hypothetical protein